VLHLEAEVHILIVACSQFESTARDQVQNTCLHVVLQHKLKLLIILDVLIPHHVIPQRKQRKMKRNLRQRLPDLRMMGRFVVIYTVTEGKRSVKLSLKTYGGVEV
jgi:hypothetical protein